MDITPEQAQAANDLMNDAGAYAALIALIGEIPSGLAARLNQAHDLVGYGCSAHSEGMPCCLDVLLDDPAKYDPARVAEARELLSQWRSNQP